MADTPDISEPAEATDGASQLEWARAVLWAAEHINVGKMSKKTAGTLARYIYWKQGREDPKQLLVDFVPKALNILDKSQKASPSLGMVTAEAEQIRDLEELLEGALEEAECKSDISPPVPAEVAPAPLAVLPHVVEPAVVRSPFNVSRTVDRRPRNIKLPNLPSRGN